MPTDAEAVVLLAVAAAAVTALLRSRRKRRWRAHRPSPPPPPPPPPLDVVVPARPVAPAPQHRLERTPRAPPPPQHRQVRTPRPPPPPPPHRLVRLPPPPPPPQPQHRPPPPPPRGWDPPPEKPSAAPAIGAPAPAPAVAERVAGVYDAAHGVAVPNDDEAAVVSCAVCLDRIANVLFKPCCHQTVCTECAPHVLPTCPLCRQGVREWVVVPPLRTAAATHPGAAGCALWGVTVAHDGDDRWRRPSSSLRDERDVELAREPHEHAEVQNDGEEHGHR